MIEEAGITDEEFAGFRKFIHETAGIHLSPAKKALVAGRLSRRVRTRQLSTYGEYLRLIRRGEDPAETQTAVDLLTTNETYFFREPSHFETLAQVAADRPRGEPPMRVWSAASSTGEEAYSIAMVLADRLGDQPWEVVGTDINSRVVARARTGHYSEERARKVAPNYLRRFCLRGLGPQEGTLLVDRALRERVSFRQANLNDRLPDLGKFDVIFLRNVLIYFDEATKQRVVARVLERLRSGGHLMVGHSDSVLGISSLAENVGPATYRKASR